MDKVPVQGRKWVWTITLSVFLLLILGIIGYNYIIPRVQMDVRVLYLEGYPGEANINVRLTNSGTKDIDSVNLTVFVREEDGKDLEFSTDYFPSIPTDDRASLNINFSGDQYIDHIISVELSFSAAGNTYSREWEIREDGGYMRAAFERSVIDWFP